MRLCPRCRLRKPDAVFGTRKEAGDHCAQCCENRGFFQSRKPVRTVTVQSHAPLPSVQTINQVHLARRERAKFEARGAPEIGRPYTTVGKEGVLAHRPTYRGDEYLGNLTW